MSSASVLTYLPAGDSWRHSLDTYSIENPISIPLLLCHVFVVAEKSLSNRYPAVDDFLLLHYSGFQMLCQVVMRSKSVRSSSLSHSNLPPNNLVPPSIWHVPSYRLTFFLPLAKTDYWFVLSHVRLVSWYNFHMASYVFSLPIYSTNANGFPAHNANSSLDRRLLMVCVSGTI
jgi:hypothetical protein